MIMHSITNHPGIIELCGDQYLIKYFVTFTDSLAFHAFYGQSLE